MLSRAARFHVLIWPEWTLYFFDSSASIISSRIASSATRALNSAEWVFLFVISDRLSNQSIYLKNGPKSRDHLLLFTNSTKQTSRAA